MFILSDMQYCRIFRTPRSQQNFCLSFYVSFYTIKITSRAAPPCRRDVSTVLRKIMVSIHNNKLNDSLRPSQAALGRWKVSMDTAVGCLLTPLPSTQWGGVEVRMQPFFQLQFLSAKQLGSLLPLWKQVDREGKHQGVERASSFGGLISRTACML